ncbi:helix-turn-helix domain-containing protein [Devosia riboflavina]
MRRQTVFSRRLREARKRLKISQAQLGILIGLDPGVASARVNRYEQAVHLPDYDTLVRLAAGLNVPLPYLFAEQDDLADAILKFVSE